MLILRGQGGVPLTVGQVHKSVRVKTDEFLHSVVGHILHPMLNQSTNHPIHTFVNHPEL